ncbi:2,4-dihydroxyhept-2-ene-1,7-dioic acid aldolase [Halomonas sp. MCCC 1A11036]|uniref:2,4-dihydroxyhept-2-ene-1,7-dioic acid aldolase n=1 Tax=Billgrantia zhangzhouensis TaxID=2733481 RepID=A0ABS9A9I9_9GAMM|nr:aldolase/citrate lyase family protein [Halomonas zhangzhouensis]MCE8018587.1 2,4-dihydroxyhept-2-ene-1,7-dioic acid aldolase [Halomonas zhangzhouensis]
MNKIRENLIKGSAVFGINVYTLSPMAIELSSAYGFDFVFIDSEHTSIAIDSNMEKLILSARASNIDSLVRVTGDSPSEIRKALELGASGVLIPQIHTADQMKNVIKAAKFPPLGRRGGDSSVRSAGFGGRGFDWKKYTERENESTFIVPMAESFEFFDNIDEILDVEGIDAVHFGPADFALSRGVSVDYSIDSSLVREHLEILVKKCDRKNIQVMAVCSPLDSRSLNTLKNMGVNMILMGSDISFIRQGLEKASIVIES